MILFHLYNPGMEIAYKTLSRSFPFVFQHLGPTLTSSPTPLLDVGRKASCFLPIVDTSPIEKVTELNCRQDPEGPQKTPSNSVSPQKLHYPYGLSDQWVGDWYSCQSYTKNYLNHSLLQFGHIYTQPQIRTPKGWGTGLRGVVLLMLCPPWQETPSGWFPKPEGIRHTYSPSPCSGLGSSAFQSVSLSE